MSVTIPVNILVNLGQSLVCFHKIIRHFGDGHPLEPRRIGEGVDAEGFGDGQPVTAHQTRRAEPYRPVDEVTPKEARGKMGAALDKQPGYAAPAERVQRREKIEIAVVVDLDVDQLDTGVDEGVPALRCGITRPSMAARD